MDPSLSSPIQNPLTRREIEWRDRQVWLESCGYMLRPRFRPGWIPSWISDPPSNSNNAWLREDWIDSTVLHFVFYYGSSSFTC